MTKDPAFLFYSSDFLNGVSDLTMEERGQYITLLCLQHQKDELTEKTIRLSVGSVSVDVINKFSKNEKGNFINIRLFEEIEKRKIFTESRRSNGLKGGRPKKDKKPSAKPTNNHMEDVNDNVNLYTNNRNLDFKNQSLKDEIWKEAIYIQKVLNQNTIEFALNDFNIHLTQQAENKNSLKEYKSHFVNWVKNRKANK